jgi:Mce-associated membrane protein
MRRRGRTTEADTVDTDVVDEPAVVAAEIDGEETDVAEPTAEVGIEPGGDDEVTQPEHGDPEAGVRWRRAVAYVVLPGAALLLAAGAGFLKYQSDSVSGPNPVDESVRAASDGTVALLSYRPDTVQKDLDAAKSRLTGSFLDAYTKLTHDVVIPGAQQKQIAAVATVPAASSASATASHAVVLLFVNQTVTIGTDAPTNTASSVRVTLDKVDGHWLISQFEPV